MRSTNGPQHRATSIPLSLPDGTQGWAHDITPDHMYVRPGSSLHVGQVLVMELRLPGSPLLFAVEGVVVAPDAGQRGTQGALVRFTHKRLHSLR
jgi:hypothetical protein